MQKLYLRNIEFYLTNVCNFNCPDCNRFNNFAFTGGRQRWADHADVYREWSNKLDVDQWNILGGEPMINPDYLLWLENIAQLWPKAKGFFRTNGHYLRSDNRELYRILQNPNLCMIISAHHPDRVKPLSETITDFLRGTVTVRRVPENVTEMVNFAENWRLSYNRIRGESWPDCDTVDQWESLPNAIKQECHTVFNFSPEQIADAIQFYLFTDSNGVQVLLEHNTWFHQVAVRPLANGTFDVYNSDPERAHATCDAKQCHQFVDGKLHKCYLTSVLPDFDQQFTVNLSDEDRDLLRSYQPLSLEASEQHMQEFVANINQAIPQCKFCPESFDNHPIRAEHGKKIHIVKRKHTEKS